MELATFLSVFPNASLWLVPPVEAADGSRNLGADLLLVGSLEPQLLDWPRLERAFADERIGADLRATRVLPDPVGLAATWAMGPEEMGRWARDAGAFPSGTPLNTDDYPYVELVAPRRNVIRPAAAARAAAAQYQAMSRAAGDVTRFVTGQPLLSAGGPISAVFFDRLGERYAKAAQPERAIAAYETAARRDPGDVTAHTRAGELLLERARQKEAEPHLAEAVRLDPDARARLGRAGSDRARASRLRPGRAGPPGAAASGAGERRGMAAARRRARAPGQVGGGQGRPRHGALDRQRRADRPGAARLRRQDGPGHHAAREVSVMAAGDNRYTFGDNQRASARLRRLAELYESETRELLQRSGVRRPRLAIDLGCGPGWSTRVLQQAVESQRTVGLDASERYVAEARERQGRDLEFLVHDVTRAPFPVADPDLLLCRFLLTHLREPEHALAAWADVAVPGARLLVHETEGLEAEHPALVRYYELLAELQRHYGQTLHVGTQLDALLGKASWRIVESRAVPLEKPASAMADLHLANLRTWRSDRHARRAFDAREIDRLSTSLERIADGIESGGRVLNTARQIVATPDPGRSR